MVKANLRETLEKIERGEYPIRKSKTIVAKWKEEAIKKQEEQKKELVYQEQPQQQTFEFELLKFECLLCNTFVYKPSRKGLKCSCGNDNPDKFLLYGGKYKWNGDKIEPIGGIGQVIKDYFGKRDLAKKILSIHPFYYDKYKMWWEWNDNSFKWEQTDETDIFNSISNYSTANTIDTKEKNEILEALKQESRKIKPRDIKTTWLQFQDTIVDINTGEKFKASPEYFVTNPLPHKLHSDNYILTPTIDKLFVEWVGEEHKKTLYQIIAYCMLPDYPLHRIFCLIGSGMNGKGCFLRLLEKVIGNYNVCSTELHLLTSNRFEASKLYKKLVCIMGETNFEELKSTSMIKKLTGQDLIGIEYKRITGFDAHNYAKLIIATNNLPQTTDKSIGWYRRWHIIDFPNQFSEARDVLAEIPEEEFEALCLKCSMLLKELLTERKFHNEGEIADRMKRYEEKSNPFEKFFSENIVEDFSGFIWSFELNKQFAEFCKDNHFRLFSDEMVAKFMKDKGFSKGVRDYGNFKGERKQYRCWVGCKWKVNQNI